MTFRFDIAGPDDDAEIRALLARNPVPGRVVVSYEREPIQRLLTDWEWLSQSFNRINRSMGFGDLYPFTIVTPVRHKLAFVHDIVTRAPLTPEQQYALALPVESERA